MSPLSRRALRVATLLAIALSSGACFVLSLDSHLVGGDADGSAPDEGIDVVATSDATAADTATADAPGIGDGDVIDSGGPFDARFRNPCTTGAKPLFCTDFDTPDAFGAWNGGATGSMISISTGQSSSSPKSLLTTVSANNQAYVRQGFALLPSMTCIMDIRVEHLDNVANVVNFGLGGDVVGATVTASPNAPDVTLRLYVNNGGVGKLVTGLLTIPAQQWVRVRLTLAAPPIGGGPLVTSFAVLSQDAGGQLDATIDAPNAPMSMRVGPHYVATPAISDQIFFDNVACDPGNALP